MPVTRPQSATERRLRRIGKSDACVTASGEWMAWVDVPNDNSLYGYGPTRARAMSNLLRRLDALAKRVERSR